MQVNGLYTITNQEGWRIRALFHQNEIPKVEMTDPDNRLCIKERIEIIWKRKDVDYSIGVNSLFEREIKRLSAEGNTFGFYVETHEDSLVITFGSEEDSAKEEFSIGRQMGMASGVLMATVGLGLKFFKAPTVVSNAVFGLGVQMTVFSYNTNNKNFNKNSYGNEMAKGVVSNVVGGLASTFAATKLVATTGSKLLAQIISQGGASATCNGVYQIMEGKEINFQHMALAGISGSVGTVASEGVAKALPNGKDIINIVVKGGVKGATGSGTSCIVDNYLHDKNLKENFLQTVLVGSVVGATMAVSDEFKQSNSNKSREDSKDFKLCPELAKEQELLNQKEQELAKLEKDLSTFESDVSQKEKAYQKGLKQYESLAKDQIASGLHDGDRSRRDDKNPQATVQALASGQKVTFKSGKTKVRLQLSPLENPQRAQDILKTKKSEYQQAYSNYQQEIKLHQLKVQVLNQPSVVKIAPSNEENDFSCLTQLQSSVIPQNEPLNEPLVQIIPQNEPLEEYPVINERRLKIIKAIEISEKHLEKLQKQKNSCKSGKGGRMKKANLSNQIELFQDRLVRLKEVLHNT